MIPLEEFLAKLRRRWLEKTVFTRTKEKFAVSIEELPPIIAPSLTGNAVNAETEKKSVYLKSNHITGSYRPIYVTMPIIYILYCIRINSIITLEPAKDPCSTQC